MKNNGIVTKSYVIQYIDRLIKIFDECEGDKFKRDSILGILKQLRTLVVQLREPGDDDFSLPYPVLTDDNPNHSITK